MPPLQARPTPTKATSADPKFLWNEIVRWTFEVCILRREGHEDAVTPLLRDRLPPLIQAWSKRCGHSADRCQQELRALFARVQESVEVGFIHRRLIVQEVCSRLAGPGGVAALAVHSAVSDRTKAKPAGIHLRRRIPLDDVPEMLDALAEAEVADFGEKILPVRSAVIPPLPEFAGESTSQVALTA
jgi:hypothetical protein